MSSRTHCLLLLAKALAVWPEIAFARQFGALRLVGLLVALCLLYLRVIAFVDLWARAPSVAVLTLVVAKVTAIACLIALAWSTRPVDDEARRLAAVLSTPVVIGALAVTGALTLSLGIRAAVFIAVGAYLNIRLARTYANKRYLGVNGGVTLAAVPLIETLVFFVR